MNSDNRVKISDDFDLFCRIAHRSPRDSLSPNDYSENARCQRRESCAEHQLNYPRRNAKRSSSVREIRRPTHTQSCRSGAGHSTARSPARSDYIYPPGSSHNNRENTTSPYRLSPHSPSSGSMATGTPELRNFTSARVDDGRRPSSKLVDRARAGSMKETARKYSVSKSAYRPSAPAAYSTSLTPNFGTDLHSPSRFSSVSAEEGLITVRSFQRNKEGKIISKVDKNIPHLELYSSTIPEDVYRNSIQENRQSVQSRPAILTDEASEQSELSEEDGDVIEIPAITTSLVHPSSTEIYREPSPLAYAGSQTHSPNSLAPGFRSRSRSWAVVLEPSPGTPHSHSSPKSELISPNELLTVQVLGTDRVGKTSLCLQFQTSESLDVTVDNAAEDEKMRTITVEVNEHKFNLQLYDTSVMQDELTSNDDLSIGIIDSADAYVVVYAIDDRSSFLAARSIVSYLLGKCKRSSAILLAANKSDLVRTRAVSVDEGKNLAAVYSCPFYEISTSLNHRVDELLVGTVVAIQDRRLAVNRERDRLERMASVSKRGSFSSPGHRRSYGALKPSTSGFVKFFQKYFFKKDKRSSALL